MTLLHFSGKFKFQPPIYNNEPGNPERYFDGSITPREVHDKITAGVEPLKYFEFEFLDVFIHKITYSNGTCATKDSEDPIIGKKILLKGLLVDTSPHLERGRLFAGEFRVLDVFMGKVELGVQSDLFKIIKNDEVKVNKYSADFETNLYDLASLQNVFVSTSNSKFLRELGNQSLKMYYHVSHYDFSSLEGDVFGYIGLKNPEQNSNNIRISKRRVLITSNIDSELQEDLGLGRFDKESNDVGRNDMEGTYEILERNRIIIFRYLNSIPFTDSEYSIPKGYRFFIDLYYGNNKVNLGSNTEIHLDPHSISNSGGVHVIQIPIDIKSIAELGIEVKCKKISGIEKTYMKEPEFDMVLYNHPNYLVLSSNEKTELAFNIFEKNKKMKKFDGIELLVGYHENLRSPLVAWPIGKPYLKEEQYVCNIQARNLENSGEIVDPIFGTDPESKSEHSEMRVKISGDLPWDRYYGNYIFVKLKVNTNIVMQQNIPVRVLHSVPIEKLKDDVTNLNKSVIQDIVSKLMRYYTRYFPWLHTEYAYVREKIKPKKIYKQFLNIDDLNYLTEEDVNHWHAIHESVNMINHLLERLERDEGDWKKMPRSRDLPINGVEFLKLWKTALLDKFAEKLDEEKNAILGSDLQEISNGEIDLTDFGDLQKIVNEIDFRVQNTTAENKKILLICKLVILNNLINESKELKTQTKHTHNH
jgi:hypothetical protein